MRKLILCVGLTVSLTIGAFAAAPATPQEPVKILLWVGHTFMGGPKCVPAGPVSHFEPPGFAAEKVKLQRMGVRVEREYFRDLATCEACHKCANYRREIMFEIPLEQLAQSEKAGYYKVAPPAIEELKEYEEGKRFRPKPDAGPRDD